MKITITEYRPGCYQWSIDHAGSFPAPGVYELKPVGAHCDCGYEPSDLCRNCRPKKTLVEMTPGVSEPRPWVPQDYAAQRAIELAERILAALNPAPRDDHAWARVTDTREGGRLFTCDCGLQTRVSGPSATEIEALAREVIRCAK